MEMPDECVYHLKRIGPKGSLEDVLDVLRLYPGVAKFGRVFDNEVNEYFVDSARMKNFVSRRHAEIHVDDDGCWLIDLGLNGTYVNDVRVNKQCRLEEGDKVTFGHKNGINLKPGTYAPQPDSEFQYLFEKIEKEIPDLESEEEPEPDSSLCHIELQFSSRHGSEHSPQKDQDAVTDSRINRPSKKGAPSCTPNSAPKTVYKDDSNRYVESSRNSGEPLIVDLDSPSSPTKLMESRRQSVEILESVDEFIDINDHVIMKGVNHESDNLSMTCKENHKDAMECLHESDHVSNASDAAVMKSAYQSINNTNSRRTALNFGQISSHSAGSPSSISQRYASKTVQVHSELPPEPPSLHLKLPSEPISGNTAASVPESLPIVIDDDSGSGCEEMQHSPIIPNLNRNTDTPSLSNKTFFGRKIVFTTSASPPVLHDISNQSSGNVSNTRRSTDSGIISCSASEDDSHDSDILKEAKKAIYNFEMSGFNERSDDETAKESTSTPLQFHLSSTFSTSANTPSKPLVKKSSPLKHIKLENCASTLNPSSKAAPRGKKNKKASTGRGRKKRKLVGGNVQDLPVWDEDTCASFDCKRPKSQKVAWVQCDSCDEWYHTACVGCDYKQVRHEDTEFHCGCV